MTKLLTPADLPSRQAYEQMRDDYRQQIMLQKQARRLLIGPNCSIHFENREIMRYQVLEMLRCEGTWDDSHSVDDELDAYNPLITQPGLLSATLMFEYPTEADRAIELRKLVGIDQHVWLVLPDGGAVLGQFLSTQLKDDRVSSVQFIKFPLSAEQQRLFRNSVGKIMVRIDHPQYNHQLTLPGATCAALADDLGA